MRVFGDFLRDQKVTPRRVPRPQAGRWKRPFRGTCFLSHTESHPPEARSSSRPTGVTGCAPHLTRSAHLCYNARVPHGHPCGPFHPEVRSILLYVLLIVGFVLLIKGADFFVDGASVLARRFHIPTVVVGLTIAAIGTSLPECAVSITAGVAGNADIAISNVVGSNLCNLLLVLGLSALVRPLNAVPALLRRDFPWCIVASVALAALGFTGRLSRPVGVALLAVCVIYLVLVVRSTLRDRDPDQEEPEGRRRPVWWIALTIIGGLAAIAIGGQLVVNNAKAIALAWGMSERMVGLTIVAIGTSLPELVTSMMAAKKGECDLAIGNVVGSCLLNILFILGAAASIVPISVSAALRPDLLLMVAATVLVYLICRIGRNIKRWEGLICAACYAAYMAFLIVR